MKNFIKVSEKEFLKIFEIYPRTLTLDCFMDWFEWYDLTLVDNNYKIGDSKRLKPALMFRFMGAYGIKEYYVREELLK